MKKRNISLVVILVVAIFSVCGCDKFDPDSRIIGEWESKSGKAKVEFFKDNSGVFYPSREQKIQGALPNQLMFSWNHVDGDRYKFNTNGYGGGLFGFKNNKILIFNGLEFKK